MRELVSLSAILDEIHYRSAGSRHVLSGDRLARTPKPNTDGRAQSLTAFGRTGKGGRPMLGPFKPEDEPEPRGMRARDKELDRLAKQTTARIDPGDMDTFANKVSSAVEKLLVE